MLASGVIGPLASSVDPDSDLVKMHGANNDNGPQIHPLSNLWKGEIIHVSENKYRRDDGSEENVRS
jgi:hypothetical protein